MFKKYKILLWLLFPIVLLATVNTVSNALSQKKPAEHSTDSEEAVTPVTKHAQDVKMVLTSGR